jgi:hypothetical protein
MLSIGGPTRFSQDAGLDILHVIHNRFDEISLTGITHTDPAH